MKKLLLLFIALALNAAFTFAQATTPAGLAPGDNPWLQLNCHNSANTPQLKPQHTVIISSVKPVIKQLTQNRWEISFIP
jgi:hypothetical protein